jgi:virginiamycin B lyase
LKRPALTRRLFVLILCLLIFALTTAPNIVHAAAGKVKEFPTPTANSGPDGITIGLDGNLWFTEAGANQIGRITRMGKVTEFGIPTANSQPFGITIGIDGNLWFTESNVSKIGRITTR